jgi:S-methylmethionine-dependent homocysteine/selenocysteine methylase
VLPQLADGPAFITDGGLETSLIFLQQVDLPHFAAFPLLDDPAGRDALRAYFAPYLELAGASGAGIVLDTPTWRASPDWGARLGYDAQALDRVNRDGVAFVRELTADPALEGAGPVVVNGALGPRGDGYDPAELMEPDEAEAYHAPQVASFAAAGADMVTAVTMTHAGEAIGIARAAAAAGVPSAISFTTETDGRLPDGTGLREALERTDAETDGAPAYYMINCAHPTHFAGALEDADGAWRERIRGLRANASALSHAELDEAEELDPGDPDDLARRYRALRDALPTATVLGGCCGTDVRHVRAILEAWDA